jgi:hypothetical protein
VDAVVVTESAYTAGQDFTGACLVLDQLGDPGRPCRVLAGEAGGIEYIDLAALDRISMQARGHTRS